MHYSLDHSFPQDMTFELGSKTCIVIFLAEKRERYSRQRERQKQRQGSMNIQVAQGKTSHSRDIRYERERKGGVKL